MSFTNTPGGITTPLEERDLATRDDVLSLVARWTCSAAQLSDIDRYLVQQEFIGGSKITYPAGDPRRAWVLTDAFEQTLQPAPYVAQIKQFQKDIRNGLHGRAVYEVPFVKLVREQIDGGHQWKTVIDYRKVEPVIDQTPRGGFGHSSKGASLSDADLSAIEGAFNRAVRRLKTAPVGQVEIANLIHEELEKQDLWAGGTGDEEALQDIAAMIFDKLGLLSGDGE
jgi:hypothetical protein